MKNISKSKFSFEISLSVLDHLGRNLYRSFVTVLGEAISNSWDADATNVKIYIDKNNNSFFIKDDGDGMSASDFQNKFLKIGYSKRKEGTKSKKKRPYIGRKGIGKLALLSCADKVIIISKKPGKKYIGGVIDNSGLDKAITNDVTPNEYKLGKLKLDTFNKYIDDHEKGTIIYFENIKDGIKHSLEFLEKIVALYFRFSLLDKDFNIFIDDKLITQECLDDLASKTQFLWKINSLNDPYIDMLQNKFTKDKNEKTKINVKKSVNGFIASVKKPRDLKIITTDEKVGVDLFVNGRLRERDILKHIPTARLVENYLYGQIHFNDLDDKNDRFASSREGIVAADPKYKKLLDLIRTKIISQILDDWDDWRIKHKQDGDPENKRRSKTERASRGLFNAVSKEYDGSKGSINKKKVDKWVNELSDDAAFNFESYAECFTSENLIRKYIREKKINLTEEAKTEAKRCIKKESQSKESGNVSIDIRRENKFINYLSMDHLANLNDKKDFIKEASLARDAKQYKPMRDAIAHTALLTDEAKLKLTTVYENIKGRIKILLDT